MWGSVEQRTPDVLEEDVDLIEWGSITEADLILLKKGEGEDSYGHPE